MTRQEITNTRDLRFSSWIRYCLPDSDTGFIVSDIDFFLYNYKTKKCAIVEVKTRNASLKFQKNMYAFLSRWIKKGIDDGWEYRGFYFIRFENTFFSDGKVFLNDIESTEEEIIKELSF
jgi:hypothetical protein